MLMTALCVCVCVCLCVCLCEHVCRFGQLAVSALYPLDRHRTCCRKKPNVLNPNKLHVFRHFLNFNAFLNQFIGRGEEITQESECEGPDGHPTLFGRLRLDWVVLLGRRVQEMVAFI